MNREEKKKYLSSYIELKRSIDSLTEEYHFWEETSRNIPISRIDATGIHGSRKKQEPITKHIDICITIQKKQEEAKKKLNEIVSVIDTLDNSDQRSVLRYRYINGYYFSEIARKMKFSLDHIFTLHRNALDNLTVNNI